MHENVHVKFLSPSLDSDSTRREEEPEDVHFLEMFCDEEYKDGESSLGQDQSNCS